LRINFCSISVCKAKYFNKFNALRSCLRQVHEHAITEVTIVAIVIGEDLNRFCGTFIPLAKELLLDARGKSMESVNLIGQAVGKEVFVADVKEVMNMCFKMQLFDYVGDDRRA
jgi:hypothetical protein